MKIAIFGASGRVGRETTGEALRRGHEVNAFIHQVNPFEQSGDPGLTLFHGDIHEKDIVSRMVAESDVVLSTLSSLRFMAKKDVVRTGAENIVPTMRKYGLTRIVTLTGNLALTPSDATRMRDGAVRSISKIPVLGGILRDGQAHLELLGESDLDWTCVRAPQIIEHGGEDYTLGLGPVSWRPIARVAVANCLVNLAEGPGEDYSQQAPFIYSASQSL